MHIIQGIKKTIKLQNTKMCTTLKNKQHRYISDKCPLLWWKANETIFPIWEDKLAAYWLYQQLAIEYSVRLGTLSIANDTV